MLHLYHHPASTSSRRVLVLAELLGTPLVREVVDVFAGEHQRPEYLRVNPNGLVPALVDGDFVLTESNAIMQYLAERKGHGALWPADLRGRADIVRWQFWQTAHWHKELEVYTYENYFKPKLRGQEPDPQALEAVEPTFHRFARVLDQHLSGREYLALGRLTLADLSVASSLGYWEAAQVPLAPYLHVRAWYGRVASMEAWRRVHALPAG